MKKLNSLAQLVIEGIYNRVYTGPNEAYRRINGKETFQVVQLNPILEIEILYHQFGSAYTEELRLKHVTIPCPEKAFKEYELYECEDPSEWFRKSIRVSSLDEAVKNGLPMEEIRGKTFRKGFMDVMQDENRKMFGITHSFQVEDKTRQQLLQTIVVLWENWDEVCADIKKHGATINN